MKKRLIVLCLTVAMCLGMCVTSQAASEISVYVNGEKVVFDQPPVIVDGRTMVPLRAIFEALGAEVNWDKSTKSILSLKNDVRVAMQIGSNIMSIQKGSETKTVTLDVPAEIVSDRTLVPVRAIAEAFGCEVTWDSSAREVEVWSNDAISGGDYYRGNAFFSNGVLYYTFIMQPYVYCYDGENTTSYAAGGEPLGLIVDGDDIYYFTYTDNYVYHMDRVTGKRDIIFSKLKSIDAIYLYRGRMLIKGRDESSAFALYSLDLSTGKSTSLYSKDAPSTSSVLSSSSAIWFAGNKILAFSYQDTDSNMMSNHMVLTGTLVDFETGEMDDFITVEGDSYNAGWSDSVTTYSNDCPTGADCSYSPDESVVYFYIITTNTVDKTDVDEYNYYKLNLSTGRVSSSTEYAYESSVSAEADRSTWAEPEWTYSANGTSSIIRTNNETGVTETLLSGSNYYCVGASEDMDMVVVMQCTRKSSGSKWSSTSGYKEARLFVMDTEGNHLKEIQSYTDDSGSSVPETSTTTSDSSAGASRCMVCAGRGWTVCTYCGGDGIATHAQIGLGGGIYDTSCSVCGGSGRRTCTPCAGTGVVYPS